MKRRILLPLLLMFLSMVMFGQRTENLHEIKLNALYLIDPILELEYEYVLHSSNSSLGVSFGRSIGETIYYKYEVLPFYRLYFDKQIGQGFFLEGHCIVFEERETNWTTHTTAVGAGLSIGVKFIRRNRLVTELVLGMGRIINKYDGNFEPYYPRLALNIGVRL